VELELSGQVALVTAASRGIGRAVAERLDVEGARVVASSRDEPALAEMAQRARSMVAMPVDLDDATATGTLVERVIAQHGVLDVLVVNTPGPPITPILETTPEDWAAAYDRLVRPAIQLALPAARHMASRANGSIVFLTSTWVRQPSPGGGLSASMRSALSALAKQMAQELAPHGVRVNQVMPGATGTQRMRDIAERKATANGTSSEQEIAEVIAAIPLGRWADATEIADAVAFVASPRAAFMTGATVSLDGGAVRSTL
jgi:3-oxoacyl-[acyl-carrier protein] reductase